MAGDGILKENGGLAASLALLFLTRFVQRYPYVTRYRAFALVRMLLEIFLDNGDDFLVGAMLRA